VFTAVGSRRLSCLTLACASQRRSWSGDAPHGTDLGWRVLRPRERWCLSGTPCRRNVLIGCGETSRLSSPVRQAYGIADGRDSQCPCDVQRRRDDLPAVVLTAAEPGGRSPPQRGHVRMRADEWTRCGGPRGAVCASRGARVSGTCMARRCYDGGHPWIGSSTGMGGERSVSGFG
jgi:hypothetical protein